ncbi:MAG: hypothetical protein A3J24_12245 [Deltaproteobacteria bacterium RIFCSPLOWO2_02_FULL_53_8]|nr:MAG: hypothetical protein A3J24_12245 [Deltaproteobacteria bacterium RIFCSPLOWO2_02_FULL_53_8]
MTEIDRDRVARAKADIHDAFGQMESLLGEGKERYLSDFKSRAALKYLLVETVEAVADVCQHLLARTKGLPCDGYIDCIVKVGKVGIISPELSNRLRRLADLRNSLIHRYWIIDDERLYEETLQSKGDIREFLDEIEVFLRAV